jgi:hypothetical protein
VTGAAPGPGPGPEPGPGRTGYTNGTRIERGWYTNGTRMELGFQKLRYLWRQIGSHSYYYFICSANPTIPCICCATQAHRVILCLCNWPIALACKATPPSFALAEHCDPVLVQASYQASWDHDACRLRSLPAIPDWATSRFEPKPHPVLSQSQNPGNGSPRRGDKGTWVVEGQLPWHSHGLRAVHKTVFVNGANKYL